MVVGFPLNIYITAKRQGAYYFGWCWLLPLSMLLFLQLLLMWYLLCDVEIIIVVIYMNQFCIATFQLDCTNIQYKP